MDAIRGGSDGKRKARILCKDVDVWHHKMTHTPHPLESLLIPISCLTMPALLLIKTTDLEHQKKALEIAELLKKLYE